MTLEVEGVVVTLGDRRVVESVDARVEPGGWLGVVGPNGAGKTTLLRAIAGLVEYQGKIRVAGREPNPRRRRQAALLVAYVPQRPVLPPAMTIVDYVLLGRSAHHSYLGAPTRRDRHVAAAVLERLDLTALAQRPLGEVSGGESQRAVLARAIAQEAPVLLMDEPTASLDFGHGQLVLELTDELRRERSLCVVSALHDLTLAAQYADRVLVLEAGRQVAIGRPRDVLTRENIESFFQASVEILEGQSGIAVAPVRPAHQQIAEPVTGGVDVAAVRAAVLS